MKKINTHTSSKFHEWRINLTENLKKTGKIPNYIIQDFDTIFHKEDKILAFIEIKRSFIELDKWKPFKADINNYRALFYLSKKIGCELWVLYKKKGESVIDKGMSLFKINSINEEIIYEKEIISFEKLKLIMGDYGIHEVIMEPLSYKDDFLEKDENNIYYILNKFYPESFYLDKSNNWSMIISNTKDYSPIVMYVEKIIEDKSELLNISFKSNLIYKISKKLNIPFLIIAYKSNFEKIYLLKEKEIKEYNLDEFEEIYSKFLLN